MTFQINSELLFFHFSEKLAPIVVYLSLSLENPTFNGRWCYRDIHRMGCAFIQLILSSMTSPCINLLHLVINGFWVGPDCIPDIPHHLPPVPPSRVIN